MTTERTQLEQAIAHLEMQRAMLGEAVVDAAIATLKEKLATVQTRATLQQRKQISVLFADVSGFTALSETLDPEDVTVVINALWSQLDAIIIAHGGWIDKHIGDAIMALWGTEQTREDDAERALRAALAMLAELAEFRAARQVALAMRIGINTGLALLGEVGTTGEFTAMGDTVNLASRLEHAAPVGGVLIAHSTYQQVRGQFDLQALDPIQVKGKQAPIQVYLVSQARPRSFHVSNRGVEGVHPPMIGREAELHSLRDAFGSATASAWRTVTVVGEAGIGKSRLLREFSAWAEQQSAALVWFKGRTSWDTQQMPYALLRDLLAARFAIQDSDPPAEVWEKLRHGMVTDMHPADPTEWEAQAHVIGQLLGFGAQPGARAAYGSPAGPQQLRDRALAGLQDYFRVLGSRQALVVLLEDLHWADERSLDTLDHLAAHLADLPVLLVGTARASLFEHRPGWGSKQPTHRRLDLRPLSHDDSRTLVGAALQRLEEIPNTLRDTIVSSAEGNPFYLEELINMLIDEGVIVRAEPRWRVVADRLTTVRIPTTLTAVLQTRLDRLSVYERGALQRGSVIGRIFWDRAVTFLEPSVPDAATGVVEALTMLSRREMLFKQAQSTFAEAHEYVFRHSLLRAATYESILKRERPAYHARAAEWLRTMSGARVDEFAGVIAEHYTAAEDHDAAVHYYQLAAQYARARYAFQEAGQYLQQARGLLPVEERGDRRIQLLEELADIYRLTDEHIESIPLYQEALELARAAHAPTLTLVRLNRKIGEVVVGTEVASPTNKLAQYEAQARSALREGMQLMEGHPPHAEMVRLLVELSHEAWRWQQPQNWDAAEEYARAALRLAEQLGAPSERSVALNALGVAFAARGLFRERVQIALDRLALSEADGSSDPHERVRLMNEVGAVLLDVGEYTRAIPHLLAAERLAIEVHAANQLARNLALQAHCAFRLDRWDEVALDERFAALRERRGFERVAPTCQHLAYNSAAHALRGKTEQARVLRDESFAFMTGDSSQKYWNRPIDH